MNNDNDISYMIIPTPKVVDEKFLDLRFIIFNIEFTWLKGGEASSVSEF